MATRPSNAAQETSLTQVLRDKDNQQLFLDSREATERYYPVNRVVQTIAAAKTLSDADHMNLIVVTADAAVTVPTGLRDDFRCDFIFTGGSGDLTITDTATVNFDAAKSLDMSTQYGRATLEAYASDTYLLSGDLDAA